jgi:hypothetical protein
MADSPCEACPTLPHFPKRTIILCSLTLLVVLGGCEAKPECESPETRIAVLKAVSDNHGNPLAEYAAKNSNVAKSNDSGAKAESPAEKPLYVLGEQIVTTSAKENKKTLECSGSISVTVGDTKASKEIDFTVQKSSDGKLSVSVAPFQF